MGEKELLQLLRDAQEALSKFGVSYNDVNAYIRDKTDGQFPGLMSLTIAVDPDVRNEQTELVALQENVAHSPASNFVRSFAQGVTLGFADELTGIAAGIAPGGQTREEATEASRTRIEALRSTNPGATVLGELAGVVATAPLGGQAFSLIRGPAGGLLRTLGASAAVGGVEGALFSAGEAEGDLIERLPSAAVGGAAGAAVGTVISGAAGLIKAVGRPFASRLRSPAQAARATLGRSARGEGLAGSEIPGAVARLGDDAILADVPAFGAQAPGAVRNAPALMRGGGPVEALRARVHPDQVAAAKRAVFAPLEEANAIIDDPNILRFLRSNPVTNNILGEVFGSPRGIKSIPFRKMQAIRGTLQKEMSTATRNFRPDNFKDALDASKALDSLLDSAVPGFRTANRQYREVLSRVEGMERLQTLLDNAFPPFDTGIPSASISEIRGESFNIPRRRETAAQLIGEILLEPGGGERAAELMRRGFFVEAFTDLRRAAGRQGRNVTQTEIGRIFGGMVTPRQGLLSGETPGPVPALIEAPTAPADGARVGLLSSGGR